MEKIIYTSAKKIIENIHKGKWTSYDVTLAFLKQIELHNPTINAISDLRPKEDILEEAKEKDHLLKNGDVLGPLHGLPITVKDGFCVKGLKATNGNPSLKNNIPDYDATLITRLKKAGAIIIGKSNIALYALDWQTNNAWFGRTNNPYNLNKIVGGSSGGSAAALAAGFTPLELGTDAGGSIRVPAHFCGVCGIRTTESALPNRGNMVVPGMPKLGRYLTSSGAMARNVEDLILMTKVLWGRDITHSENPPVLFKRNELHHSLKIKIAYSNNLGNHPLSSSYKVIYQDFIKKVKNKYSSTTLAKPNYNDIETTMLWGKIAGYDFKSALKKAPFKSLIAKLFILTKYKHSLWAKAMQAGAGSSANKYAYALERKDELGDVFTNFFNEYDIWITPVCISEAFDHQKTGTPIVIDGNKIPYGDAFIPYNFTTTPPGHPIVVIPIGMTEDGLPVGVQIHGEKWEDYRLLQIAKELQSLTNGFVIPERIK